MLSVTENFLTVRIGKSLGFIQFRDSELNYLDTNKRKQLNSCTTELAGTSQYNFRNFLRSLPTDFLL